MALDWPIPSVDDIHNVGPEWLFTLLEPLDEATRMIVLKILWRIWHVRLRMRRSHQAHHPQKLLADSFMDTSIHSCACSNTQVEMWSTER